MAPVPTVVVLSPTKESFIRKLITGVPVFPGKAEMMNCIIFSTTEASRGLLILWLMGAPFCKRLPLTWGAHNWRRNKDGQPKLKWLAQCHWAHWWQQWRKSLVHLNSSSSDLIGMYGQTHWIKPLFWFLLPYFCFMGWKNFSKFQWGKQEDLYLNLILILIFVHLEQRRTPSVPLAEATYLKLSTGR